MMFARLLLLGSALFIAGHLHAQPLEERLESLGFDSIRPFEITSEGYTGAWELFLKQPLDHKDPDGTQFLQRVVLRHRGFDKPVVFVTEGYAAHYALSPRYNNELAVRLDANLIVAEHRFFGRSMPDSLVWEALNLQNMAADLNRITASLKEIYTAGWLSTGISKGGQTSIYYRYFYPDDVKATVPYVAPLNFSDEDERVYHFLDTVGSEVCREKIRQIQHILLAEQAVFRQMFADSAARRELSFEIVGGIEKAFEYNVLEFSFAYWQWYPFPCDQLPHPNVSADSLYTVFIAATGYDFFADQGIMGLQPFFYQALTEMGMYSYRIDGFEDVLRYVHEPCFRHTLPEGDIMPYDPGLSLEVDAWLKAHGNNMLYIYGAYDAWSATAVQAGAQTNTVTLWLPEGSHRTRLRHFPEYVQTEAIALLRTWLGLQDNSNVTY